ncbi:PilW family protein [Comamonas sp. Y6]|nr:PilW family protein [Comamonas resistens]MDL5035294.1 PilW family protein [Comamonas resistens]
MLIKNIASRATPTTSANQKYLSQRLQRGVTLLELMVGIAIGLLVVAVASGALMVSRSVSGTVSDASSIQQQATYAMRVIGQQLRQAGSLYLNPQPNPAEAGADAATLAASVVVFEATAGDTSKSAADDLLSTSPPLDYINPATSTLLGSSSPDKLAVGYRRYKEAVYGSSTEQTLLRNCLGSPSDDAKNDAQVKILSVFERNDKNELQCTGNGTVQPLARNVANFQVRYLLQDNSVPGATKIQYVAASKVGTASDWGKVQAAEVCLVLYGDEAIDLPADSAYTGCDGSSVNIPTTGAEARRMHITFRNVFQLRSQGLLGTVL